MITQYEGCQTQLRLHIQCNQNEVQLENFNGISLNIKIKTTDYICIYIYAWVCGRRDAKCV